jgi:hypothetical protein
VPELLLAIATAVARGRRPGRFLLTGSANVRFVPRAVDSLVGSMAIRTVWPLSQGEMVERREGFFEAIRRRRLPDDPPTVTVEQMVKRVVRGAARPSTSGRRAGARRGCGRTSRAGSSATFAS